MNPNPDSSVAAILGLLFVAALVAGVLFFVISPAPEVPPGSRPDAPPGDSRPTATRNSEPRNPRAQPATSLAAGQDEAALREQLAAIGIERLQIPDGHLLLAGRVVTRPDTLPGEEAEPPAAEPVPGASVLLYAVGADGIAAESPEASATARADGIFFATVPTRSGWILEATASDFLSSRTSVAKERLRGRIAAVGDLLILKTARVQVTVTSGAAEIMEPVVPVEGMEIAIAPGDGPPLVRGRTGKDGKVVLAGLPRQEVTVHGVLAPYGEIHETASIVRDGQELNFNVALVGRLKVQVKTAAGAVLKSFSLAVDFQHETYGYLPPVFSDVETTDEDGWYVVGNLKSGSHDVYATAKGFAIGVAAATVEAGATGEISVLLPLGFTVEGRVVTKKDERPVEGAIVFSEKDLIPSSVNTDSRDGFRPMARAARTDRQGRFRLEDLTEGQHRLTATHPEFAEHVLQDVKVAKDTAKEDVVFKLPLGATLTGHSYGPDGAPSAGDTVMVIAFMDPPKLVKKKPPLRAVTNAEGFYRIEHVPPAQRLVFRMAARPGPGQQPFEMKVHSFREGVEAVVDFGEPSQDAVVEGRITNAKGEPVRGIQVSLMRTEAAAGSVPVFHQGAVDDDGRYEVRGLKAGRYAVQVAKAGKGSDFAAVDTVDVPASGRVHKDVVLTGGSIEGRVVSKDTGQGLDPGEVVVLRPGNTPDGGEFVGRAVLDRNGRFSFPHLAPGTYAILASARDHGNRRVPGIEVLDGGVTSIPEIELVGGGRIHGLVLDAEGRPVAAARIVLIDPATQAVIPAWSFGSGDDGSFTADYVPAGWYLASAVKPGLHFAPVPVTVSVGGGSTVTISAH